MACYFLKKLSIFTPMIKRFSIALLFFSAFAVVMAHSVIPHHHHDEEETATGHHDKDHDDDSGLGNLFSHFQHVGATNQFLSAEQLLSIRQTDIPQPGFIFTNFCDFYFSDEIELPLILFPDHPDIYSFLCSAVFSLRGPPYFTV